MTEVEISIVIPIKNADIWIEETLSGIMRQTLFYKAEIILIDSGSTDCTLELIQRYPVKLIQIEPEDFNHGRTRNLGAKVATGKYIVMTVQDAKPVDDCWLEKLVQGFENDENVAGVCGQQIVGEDLRKNPVEWFRPFSAPSKKRYFFPDFKKFESLSPREKKEICSWDNVNSMYRKEVLLSVPFQEVSFAEDALWAKDALSSGYGIVYQNAARVYHYHHEAPEYTFKRALTTYYHLYLFFGLTPDRGYPQVIPFIRNLKLLVMDNRIKWSDKFKWLYYNYQCRKSIYNAKRLFKRSLDKGLDVLHSVHNEHCKYSPQAIKYRNA